MLYGSWPVEHAADQIVSCFVVDGGLSLVS